MAESLKFQHYEVSTREDGSPFELGRGAMGITYKAFDTNLRCSVALKVINGAYLNSEIARQRFLREARAAAALRHPNVAAVFHLGEENDCYFYAMEFIDGETLEAFIRRRGTLDAPLALRITLQVARALSAAQKQGLVHRDIKPANLMLVHDQDDDLLVKVIDFGLAKAAKSEGIDATLTMGGFVGTPHFASPEQLEEREIDTRSDIYSLGVTLWYMLAGKPPFGGSLAQIMSQHLSKEPPVEKLGEVPAPVVTLLQRMLAKEPEDRPQTPLDLRRDIEQCLAQLGYGSIAPALTTPAEQVETLDMPTVQMDETQIATMVDQITQAPATGVIIGGRYQMLEEVGEDESGKVFRAFDQELNRRVAIRVLSPNVLTSAEAVQALELVIEQCREWRDPNFLQYYRLERTHQYRMVVQEWVNGFSFAEFLRKRGALSPNETISLIEPLARMADFATSQGLNRVPLSIHSATICFEMDPPADQSPLLAKQISEWPPYVVKMPPFDLRGGQHEAATWMGERTIAQPRPIGQTLGNQLALVAFEMLGGAPDLLMAGRFSPIPALPEAGNVILKRALEAQGETPFATATEFVKALKEAIVIDGRGHKTVHRTPPPPPMPTKPRGKPGNSNVIIALTATALVGLLAVTGLAYAAFALLKKISPSPSPTPVPLVSPTPAATPERAISPTPAPTTLPSPTSSPSPAPSPTQAPTPAAPTPSRGSLLREALGKAEKINERTDLAAAVQAYVEISKQFPESIEPKDRLEALFEPLLSPEVPVSPSLTTGFSSNQPAALVAAQNGVTSAMMYLAEQQFESAPEKAVEWFKEAAKNGNTLAMNRLGLMFSNGRGVERSLEESVRWFGKSADKGDPMGEFLLAECLLLGKGTAPDPSRALELLEKAGDRNEARALNLLGTVYDKGMGVEKNPTAALRYYEKAASAGSASAYVNLGILYANGRPPTIKVDQAKALSYIKKGADAGDSRGIMIYGDMLARSGDRKQAAEGAAFLKANAEKGVPDAMYAYAMLLLEGVGVTKNGNEATRLMSAAATAGYPPAKEWCRKNGTAFVPNP